MTVNGLDAAGIQGAAQHHHRHGPPKLTNTAELLGMSVDELQKAQRSGTTLADLAATKGVSKDDLVKSIVSDLKADAPEGAQPRTDAQLTEMATNIADGKRPSRAGHAGGGEQSTDRSSTNVSSLADALGVDPATLLQRLQSGEDPAALLEAASPTQYGNTSAPSYLSSGLTVDHYV
jgi:uncharacterized protein YidB (DUF937 family)